MIKRTLYFSNPAYLNLRDQQLQIDLPNLKALGKEDAKKHIPIEDIGIVILDHQQITITHACMAALLANNVALITCNHTHHPVGLLLPIDGHHTQSERYKYQIEASQPLKKQLWQQTIQAKILNQAAVLFERGIPCENMVHWAKSVKSGDPDNYEGRAAAYYWKNVFPKKLDFFRGREGDPPNNLLNYGYAILRAIVARGIVSSGLIPTLGIHHKNKYNAYCLADDVMEPYRPFVDKIVLKIIDDGENFLDLSTPIKSKLLGIASVDVSFERGTSPLMVGVQYTTASLAKCYEGGMRKINYPIIKDFDAKKVKLYQRNENMSLAAEEEIKLIRPTDEDDRSLPF
ncbi:MAG: type II CRISPR-associated endonuclease Cas1 [Bacteroidetes bacterium]|nr:type II CRISPR-associated endonuclease Cas1 [Bacteroidota bacterium]MBU1374258.1 type II CRISPR-associated endonuclease Cas1 [Bacteroidota bacterium]MBU1483707.1 type II CRISPR-associated endonuclease Cas1 [Bacteroidota bacterium]MBU1760553.1 type II CRISPR-associated endonuclease Cas1 [Bacteroidota bacterium]MBU2267825.1 type II CRISPR-associated endonuclease Cas1 [Bacteroidota bacterium]